jgi:molybdate transport system substrate-binding protein
VRAASGRTGGRPALLGVLVAASLAFTACSGGTGDPASGGRIIVLAAASLTESFTAIARQFERDHAGVTVDLSFGPSDGLAGQIEQGSPADVFASASARWMDDVDDRGPGVTDRAVFARNRLVVITPTSNPAGIHAFQDLAKPGIKLVLAAVGVPVGDYGRQALRNAGVSAAALGNVVSNEDDVKAVLNKVLLGEADAGIVYQTDVTAAVKPKVAVVPIQDAVNVVASYPIAVVSGSRESALAEAFVQYVRGPGQPILRSFGFLPPR